MVGGDDKGGFKVFLGGGGGYMSEWVSEWERGGGGV